MKRFLLLVILISACKSPTYEEKGSFTTLFETSGGTQTPTYEEVIDFYIELAREFPEINIQTMGETDSGYPLHIVSFNDDGEFNFSKIRERKAVMLINNGIHPGESDGIDATMMLFRDLATGQIEIPKRTVLVAIPLYNIGGSLNRNSTSRTNQNGPEEYGFRGNSRNYDLNRDFIKADTKNARAFAEIFHLVQPDVFIDNHVSNGADYQYTLTHLFTQHNKLGGELGNYLHTVVMPSLEQSLEEKEWDVTPYVNVFNRTPESGFSQFMDYPRYSTGYTTLWNTLGMMVETHMLKPYKQRVEGTYELMRSMIDITEKERDTIKMLREKAFEAYRQKDMYTLDWAIDTTKASTLNFKGYEGEQIVSEVTGANRLKYNRERPFTKEVTYRNYFSPRSEVSIPEAYIIPQGWWNVISRLRENKVEMREIGQDTVITAESYRIESYGTRNSAYEGHYQHFNTKVSSSVADVKFRKGDFIVPTDQPALRYIIETLEPAAPDSFFNWNYFDTVLQQKEGFSPYVFEDIAKELLAKNEDLRTEFQSKLEEDEAFAGNWYAQLDWIHKHSDHYEKAHLRYPVFRFGGPDPGND
ncbi:hypothetical protein GWK08_02795 [Leptobacterium flavescens]|uniref:Peptidase M14 carboxypeptidase A domain-containing protein n=1 Tax=Leptobacterium flavescens TaxID=472055 RepID=A0A6P0UGJ4_9FLAO|nr:M14 family metallopeptidase [Leptobacterium flavescens]NER12355.1 hypothetical protein [Leptobacterium flavescens]